MLRLARVLIVTVAFATAVRAGGPGAPALPDRLSGAAFSQLSSDLSEPGGAFPSDNLVSNELLYGPILDELSARVPQRSVHVGVGPEQNFTYIAATRPGMVFIIDVRRGNLQLQLMYKALFELADNRSAFVSRLFGRNVPRAIGPTARAAELFDAIEILDPNRNAAADFAAIKRQLTERDGLTVSSDDLAAIQRLLGIFWERGPEISYAPYSFAGMPAYSTVMKVTHQGKERSFLASEASFLAVKDLQARNLIVPLVGNLAGPKSLRAIGEYVRAHAASISTMYISNVEQYLSQDRSWPAFCGNVRSLPLTEASTFIRSNPINSTDYAMSYGLVSSWGSMLKQTESCSTDPGAARVWW